MPQQALRSICLGLALSPFAGLAWAQSTPATQSPPATTVGTVEFARLRDQAASESEAGKTADAIRDYQQALTLQPDWKEGWWKGPGVRRSPAHAQARLPSQPRTGEEAAAVSIRKNASAGETLSLYQQLK